MALNVRIRSNEMSLMHEHMARAHINQRLREAREASRSREAAREARLSRRAARAGWKARLAAWL